MLQAGTTIADKYELERQLGEGGMGVVWSARHVELGDKRVAIKFLFNALNANLRARFRREALLASRIQSRHVVSVMDAGEFQGAPYIVMELLEGQDLRHLLTRQRVIDKATTVAIIAQAARGLQKAHNAGLIHRDIKPENLFLCTDEDGGMLVKVLDFGIAKSLEADSHTATGMMIGTAYYVSPEQFQGLKGIDHKTDLWSFACVVYEMLVGSKVFDGDSVFQIGMLIMSEKRPVPSEVAPGLPAAFDAWIQRALHPNPASRFSSAIEMAQSLSTALEVGTASQPFPIDTSSESIDPPAPGPTFSTTALANTEMTTTTPPLPSPRTRRVVGAVSVVGLGALAVVGFIALRAAPKVTPEPAAAAGSEVQSAASSGTPSSSSEAVMPLLDRATALAKKGDVVAAHDLLADVPVDSPLRSQAGFAEVENAWADAQLSKADGESDAAEKRRVLNEVISSAAGESKRQRARTLLDSVPATPAGGKGAKVPTPTKPPAGPKPSAAEPPTPTPPSTLPPRF